MGAPKGNQFWKLRSKHGRDKLFASPELLWKAACEYFQWCENNPWMKQEQVKQPGKGFRNDEGDYVAPQLLVEIPTARPFTMQGLCLYLDASVGYFRTFKSELKEVDKGFLTVITRIEETIYMQKFEGASVGAFNANIIARDLGLTDKTENKTVVSGKVSLLRVQPITGQQAERNKESDVK